MSIKNRGCKTCGWLAMEWVCPVTGRRAGAVVENCPSWELKKVLHKFRAFATEVDGIKFASKKEAAYYAQLKLRVRAGEVLFFLRQAPFHLPGGVRYVVDFVEFKANGTVDFVDVKGMATKEYKIKKTILESLYPVKIVEA